MKSRRSRQIQLVTLGSVILGACSDADIPKDRYAYKSQPECVQDWGDKNCERAPSSSGGGSGYYYGPHFNSIVETPSGKHIWSGNASMPAINPNTGQQMHGALNVSAARGGFGKTGSSFSTRGG
jgi:uncharacterized protein YgiB involved in biofilm formation